jgi:hypothetical protein
MMTKQATSETLEIVRFRLNEGTNSSQFLEAVAQMNQSFLSKQAGFLNRQLAQAEDGIWTDIVHWESLQKAQEAMQIAETMPNLMHFMQMIDATSIRMEHITLQNSFAK